MTTYSATNIDEIAITATTANDVAVNSGTISAFGTASTTIAVADIGVCTILPANHVPVDMILDFGDCDSGTSLVVEAGFVGNDDAGDDDSDAFGAGYTTGQAGGVARANAAGFTRIAAVDHDRKVGIKVTTLGVAPATPGKVTGVMISRPKVSNRDR